MSNFQDAFNFMIKHEGGYVNDPNDAGGETKYGISKRQYPHLNIKTLRVSDAREIYHKDYWIPSKLEEVTSKAIAIKVFDTGVNMGMKTAIKFLQEVCNELAGTKLTADGLLGPKTLTVLNRLNEQQVLSEFRKKQEYFYRRLAKSKPANEKFLKGWINRAMA